MLNALYYSPPLALWYGVELKVIFTQKEAPSRTPADEDIEPPYVGEIQRKVPEAYGFRRCSPEFSF